MKSKYSILTLVLASAAGVHSANAAVLFSTTFAQTSATADGIAYNGGTAVTVGFTGAGSNLDSTYFTVTDTSKVDLTRANIVSNGTSVWGATPFGTSSIYKGEFFVTNTDLTYTGSNAIRGTGTGASAQSIQFNASSLNSGTFNLVFEIKAGQSYDNWSASFMTGTASTVGVWHDNTGLQNGNFNVSIFALDPAGLIGSSPSQARHCSAASACSPCFAVGGTSEDFVNFSEVNGFSSES